MIECRTMGSTERIDAFALMRRFRADERTLGDALNLYIERPDYGFLWLAYLDETPVGCAGAAFGIDSEAGGLAATVRDLYVAPEVRRRGIGSALLVTLQARLERVEVRRIDVLGGDQSLVPFLHARDYQLVGGHFTLRR